MSGPAPSPCIRSANDADLPAIYNLAAAALTLEGFSSGLLWEKLFDNPAPEQFHKRVYAAEMDGHMVGFMQCVERPAQSKGWLGVFAVRESHRRRGIGSALFDRLLADWRKAGIAEAEVLAIPGNYFNPGIDPRYTAALCFVEAKGFQRFKDCVNLTAFLDQRFETQHDEAQLADQGITVRRATRDDDPLLDAFFAGDFGPDWRMEAELAMRNEPPALHLALKAGQIIGFSGHSSQNREWGFFGPMGTTPAARGTGIGRILLRRCLNDLFDAGHRTSVIPWVGPIGFYSRYVPCRVERVFWRYRRAVTEPSMPAT
ncbi:MAG: GNAT family N-acetyltransferase [Phycisphaerae bacterium]|nr:GNAT family N-acetyltransferase [Phycisphaerae bacterium]